jgi:hypothetical protein
VEASLLAKIFVKFASTSKEYADGYPLLRSDPSAASWLLQGEIPNGKSGFKYHLFGSIMTFLQELKGIIRRVFRRQQSYAQLADILRPGARIRTRSIQTMGE